MVLAKLAFPVHSEYRCVRAASRRNCWRASVRWVMLQLAIITAIFGSGCRTYHNLPETIGNRTAEVDAIMRRVDAGAPAAQNIDITQAPLTLRSPDDFDNVAYLDWTLQQTIDVAMTNGSVLRDLGATVLRAPQAVLTQELPALTENDPLSGIEAALAAFDTQFTAIGKFQNNDRKFNNRFFGGGANSFKQDTHDYLFQLSKRTATGAELAVRSVTDYDANNATGNLTNSAWQTQLHAEARQPLLQGAGATFNRIAGPGARPGVYNGVLIAKVNNDITEAKFRQGARDYISNVVNAYWDLYFAYRDLSAKRDAFERSRETWQKYEALKKSDRQSGTSEALAREQYYRFESDLQDAITGKLVQRTQVNNSTSGGTFSGLSGVQAAERRLRLLIGMTISDASLIRPSDNPSTAPIVFDWDSITLEAMQLRSELQQQRLVVQRRQMELLAAKNFLMPQLDLVSIYRVRGLDQQLAGNQSAFKQLGNFDYQEYEAGVELVLPIGFRQGHAAVRYAQIQVARDRAVLQEQERQVLHDLTAVVADCDRAYVQVESNLNRYLAANDALDALQANQTEGLQVNLEQLLDAQRRVSEAESRYHLSLSEYAVATKNVHFEKGTLLEYAHMLVVDDQVAELGDLLPKDQASSTDAPDLTDEADKTSDAPADRTLDSNSSAGNDSIDNEPV